MLTYSQWVQTWVNLYQDAQSFFSSVNVFNFLQITWSPGHQQCLWPSRRICTGLPALPARWRHALTYGAGVPTRTGPGVLCVSPSSCCSCVHAAAVLPSSGIQVGNQRWLYCIHWRTHFSTFFFSINLSMVRYPHFANVHIDGLMQDCNNSSALALELLQSCTKPSISCK